MNTLTDMNTTDVNFSFVNLGCRGFFARIKLLCVVLWRVNKLWQDFLKISWRFQSGERTWLLNLDFVASKWCLPRTFYHTKVRFCCQERFRCWLVRCLETRVLHRRLKGLWATTHTCFSLSSASASIVRTELAAASRHQSAHHGSSSKRNVLSQHDAPHQDL